MFTFIVMKVLDQLTWNDLDVLPMCKDFGRPVMGCMDTKKVKLSVHIWKPIIQELKKLQDHRHLSFFIGIYFSVCNLFTYNQ